MDSQGKNPGQMGSQRGSDRPEQLYSRSQDIRLVQELLLWSPRWPVTGSQFLTPQSKTNFQFKFITTLVFGVRTWRGYISIIRGRADKV